jgi:hypothetical protein
MHRRGRHGVGYATTHLKAAVRDRAFDNQAGLHNREQLQKEDARKRCRHSLTRHLEVACAWEDNPAIHDMIGDEMAEASGRSA